MQQKHHWATKHSSAAVATERPISTLESQESIRPNRCTSARGMSERKPQPSTNTAESRSCLFRNRPTGASAVADWRATRWAVRCHPQALMTATAQSTVHHAATPLDRSSAGRWTSRTFHSAANATPPAATSQNSDIYMNYNIYSIVASSLERRAMKEQSIFYEVRVSVYTEFASFLPRGRARPPPRAGMHRLDAGADVDSIPTHADRPIAEGPRPEAQELR